ncbi:MAG: GntR family transcriptional regulator [Oscillospiraceae bacterium]|nr:GntR family transcriptional regulator [Oscillospiraceae bacterium]
MEWTFQPDLPIYTQLVAQMTQAILSGAYAPGARLPAVRELAAEAGVNPNTMQRAMAELEQSGLIFSQRTSGRFVTDDETVIDDARHRQAQRQVDAFWRSMALLGYDRDRTLALLTQNEKEEDV